MTLPQVVSETRWTRTKTGLIAGVCEGIARRLGLETWLIRFVLVMSILIFGTGILVYVVLALCLPREDRIENAYKRMVLGVCVRLSCKLNLEIGIVRSAFAFIMISSFGVAIVAYIALYFLMPDNDKVLPTGQDHSS